MNEGPPGTHAHALHGAAQAVSSGAVNAAADRLPSMDAVKGLLVLTMVAYHVLSIASTGGEGTLRYIRFVSGSFIFLAGFVAAHFVVRRFAQDRMATARQLVGRGLKVLALFTALNLAIAAMGFGNIGKQQLGVVGYFDNAATIYLVGDNRLSSFLILLPIGYLLIAAPLVLMALLRAPVAAPLALLSAALLVAQDASLTEHWPNAELLMIGLAGMAAGAPAFANRALHATAMRLPWLLIGLAALLWLTGRFATGGALYIAGVALILKLTHDTARRLPERGVVLRELVRLGRCSLFAYIAQIAVIQLMFRAFGAQRWAIGIELLLFGIAAAALTLALCVALGRLCVASSIVDRCYRAVFM